MRFSFNYLEIIYMINLTKDYKIKIHLTIYVVIALLDNKLQYDEMGLSWKIHLQLQSINI